MSMIVLVNGRPMKGRLELRSNEVGNYVIVKAEMVPFEDTPLPATVPVKPQASEQSSKPV